MDEIEQKIINKNPWHVTSQLKQITAKHSSRSIQKRWKFILSAIKKFKKDRERKLKILDAGCGDGVNLKVLTKIPNAKIYGIDYNPIRIERSKKKFPRVKIIKADLTELDIIDKFDVILCSQVLEHIREDENVLENFHRILDDKGILILGIPNEGCFLAQLRNNIIEPYIRKTTDHVNFYREEIIRKKIKNTGFLVENVMYESFFFPHLKINALFSYSGVGFKVMNLLGSIFKSQVAGYYFLLRKVPI